MYDRIVNTKVLNMNSIIQMGHIVSGFELPDQISVSTINTENRRT